MQGINGGFYRESEAFSGRKVNRRTGSHSRCPVRRPGRKNSVEKPDSFAPETGLFRAESVDIAVKTCYNKPSQLDRVYPKQDSDRFQAYAPGAKATRTAGSNAEFRRCGGNFCCLIDCVKSASFISWLL